MARAASGQVVVRKRKDGNVYALRFHAYNERKYITLGTEAEGWDHKRLSRKPKRLCEINTRFVVDRVGAP